MSESESKSETPIYDDQATTTDDLHDLPTSSKLVYKILEHEGEQTQAALVEKSRLPARTVRYAIGKLDAAGLVDSRTYIGDARKSVYSTPEVAVDGA